MIIGAKQKPTPDTIGMVPLGDMVFVHVIKITESAGGIALSEATSRENAAFTPLCEVIAIGDECKKVQVGDMVLVPQTMPVIKVSLQHCEFVGLHECDILGYKKRA